MIPGGGRALVTGSTDGIGFAIASRLARGGCDVLLHGLEPEAAMAARCGELAVAHGVRVDYVRSDLSDEAGVRRLADAVLASGGAGILVNNAVVRDSAAVTDLAPQSWQRALAVNLTAPLRLVQLLLPGMRDRGWGRIVNMASIYGLRATVNRVDYVSTKSGLLGLTRAVALETAGQGITCNAVCPGTVLTPGIDARIAGIVAQGASRDEAERHYLAGKQPSGRFVQAADVAELVAFLCGPAAKDITGATLPMDGGWLAG
jgi:3-hydroxybutyrate dehydrogenase